MEGDTWGEPLSVFVGEFWVLFKCFEGLEEAFEADLPDSGSESLNEARLRILDMAKKRISSDVTLVEHTPWYFRHRSGE
jgi:hypothetical protein